MGKRIRLEFKASFIHIPVFLRTIPVSNPSLLKQCEVKPFSVLKNVGAELHAHMYML
jgi:hypothetical protein